jgi:hypothetical protein
MKTISAIAADRTFRLVSMVSGFGLAVSFCLMAAGLQAAWT